MLKIYIVIFLIFLPIFAMAFVIEYQYSTWNAPGFFSAVWHGLLAPYSLIARWFIDGAIMYAAPNTGWFYDAGFLLGIAGSLPIGWIAAIISFVAYIFF